MRTRLMERSDISRKSEFDPTPSDQISHLLGVESNSTI